MSRFSLLPLVLVLAAPAFAKPVPVSCSDLWSALTDTLVLSRHFALTAYDAAYVELGLPAGVEYAGDAAAHEASA